MSSNEWPVRAALGVDCDAFALLEDFIGLLSALGVDMAEREPEGFFRDCLDLGVVSALEDWRARVFDVGTRVDRRGVKGSGSAPSDSGSD